MLFGTMVDEILDSGQHLIVIADKGQVGFNRHLDRRIDKALGDVLAVALFTDLRQVVLGVGVLDIWAYSWPAVALNSFCGAAGRA